MKARISSVLKLFAFGLFISFCFWLDGYRYRQELNANIEKSAREHREAHDARRQQP